MENAGTPIETGSLSRKVISIAAGEAHTLALTGDGRVYSWGRGTFGRLGTSSEADQLFPVRVNFYGSDDEKEEKLKIVGIAAGAYHSLALADDGSVWGWGYNALFLDPCTDGQIGVNEENSLVPRILEGFLELGSPDSSKKYYELKSGKLLKISSVKAGGMMSLAIDNLGGLWIWGNCPHSQQSKSSEGKFALVSSSAPIPIWDFHGHTVVKVACGNDHVVALVSAGETYEGGDLICYSWGGNNHGQLGLGDRESRLHPEVIETFNSESPWDVYDVACGASHTAILAKKKRPSDTLKSFCWTFGLGDKGQLGHGTTKSFLSPEPVKELPQSMFLISVDCGLFHTSVVSSAGDVWSWGMEKGLGLCPDASFSGNDAGDAVSPLLLPCTETYDSKFPVALQVACGAAHTVLVADGGHRLWSWGRGRSGVLGNGKIVDCYAPTLVMWPPHSDDFKDEEPEEVEKNKTEENNPEEIDERLSGAMDEMKLLQSKLSIAEKYASILHGSIFGKPFQEHDIPSSLKSSGSFDVAKEWDNMLESSDSSKLVRLEMFHRDMLRAVEDKLMKRRIQEMIRESLNQVLPELPGARSE
ncbi:Regulator of chromosome condensation (RCC1) family protein [Forsythia ovata]|uniref:Regulator of chromosome condensation (RCC1) family protein n=1 Tax=Forsythia ovata TaxID=205694 RepID=A0ABD1W200_9LAMI